MNWHDYFTYNAETGDLIWKERPREHFNTSTGWRIANKMYSGKVAGCASKKGYIFIGVLSLEKSDNGRRKKAFSLAHRVAWEMNFGPIPKGLMIDHIDRNPSNNRLSNLRLATSAQNLRNKNVNKNNKLGIKGISFNYGKFSTSLSKDRQLVFKGSYDTLEEAKAAYDAAVKLHHGEFAPKQNN